MVKKSLKHSASITVHLTTFIINISIAVGTVAEEWKDAKVEILMSIWTGEEFLKPGKLQNIHN